MASRPGARRSSLGFELAKLRESIEQRLGWLPQIACVLGVAVGWWLAPTVDRTHAPDRLQQWFGVVGALLAGAGITLLFATRGKRSASAARFLGAGTVLYVIVGIAVSAVGLLPLHDGLYRYLFAASVGAVAAFATTLALMAITHIRTQRTEAVEDKTDELFALQEQGRRRRRRRGRNQ